MTEQDKGASTESSTLDGDEQGTKPKTETAKKEDTITITQSDLDRKIAGAVHTSIVSLKADFEKAEREKALESEGKYQELLEESRAEIAVLQSNGEAREYKLEVRAMLDEMGMSGFADVIISDHVESIETTRGRAERLKSKFNAETQSALEKRLDTGSNVPRQTVDTDPVSLGNLSGEHFLAEKKRRGLF